MIAITTMVAAIVENKKAILFTIFCLSLGATASLLTMPSSDVADSVSKNEVLQGMKEGDVLFVDSRDKERFDEGHIGGAVSIPYHNRGINLDTMDTILHRDEYHMVVVYGDQAYCSSAEALARLVTERFGTKVYFLQIGFEQW